MKQEAIYTKVMVNKLGDLKLYDEYRDARNWCTSHFGPSKNKHIKGYGSPWYAKRERKFQRREAYGNISIRFAWVVSFHFRDPAHATLFTLRWA